jgi:ADP-heptose:LPS heptosyltransferase
MKFLIIRFSSIGDIVLTTPVIRCLKQQIPDAEIHFLTKGIYKNLLENNPYINKIITLDLSWDLMIHQLEIENYDYIIDLHHNLRTLRVKKALHVKSFSFNKLNIQKWLLTALKINTLPKVHIVDRYLDTVKKFNIINDGQGLDYFYEEDDEKCLNDIPLSHKFGYIAVVIGAQHATKKLPKEKLKHLCNILDYPIILLGGKEDKKGGKYIASDNDIKIYNACGIFKLNESAVLVKHADAVISHDTGLMHIAAAFKKKIISVWGNTIPEFGMEPYYGQFEIGNKEAEIKNLRCRPCSKIGYNKCPKKHFKCMRLQNIDKITNDALQLAKASEQ